MSWKQRILAQHHDLGQLLNYPLVLSNIAMDNDSFLDLSPSPFPGVRSYGKNSGKFHSHPAIPWFHLFFSRGFIVFFHVCLLIIDLWMVVYSFFHGVYRYLLGFTCFFPVFSRCFFRWRFDARRHVEPGSDPLRTHHWPPGKWSPVGWCHRGQHLPWYWIDDEQW